MSPPILDSEETPYLPTAKAIAPKAPSRGGLHDEAQNLEHDPGEALHAVKDGGADLAHGVQGDAEDDGDEDDLQDVAHYEGLDDAGGNDVGDELPPFLVG